MNSKGDEGGLKRVNYHMGQLLTVEDFKQEQEYHLEKHRRHNRCLHGCGIVCGLEVSTEGNAICVGPGFALDCCGNEIWVHQAPELRMPQGENAIYVGIRYAEKKTDPAPLPGTPAAEGEEMQYKRIEESFEITFDSENPSLKHKQGKFGWHPCGTSHVIPLGKLLQRRGRWMIDVKFRRPLIK
jgi:hypothetical protein